MNKNSIFTLLLLGSLSFTACNSLKTAQNNSEAAQELTENVSSTPPAPETLHTDTRAVTEVVKAEKKIKWLTMEEAYAANQKEPRKIFVDVYTDWCGWCKKMDKETFANAEVAEYVNENYYAVKLDAESEREFELAGEKMTERAVARHMGVSSFPTIVFIHEDFKSIQPVPGYRPAKDFKEILTKFKAIDINQK